MKKIVFSITIILFLILLMVSCAYSKQELSYSDILFEEWGIEIDGSNERVVYSKSDRLWMGDGYTYAILEYDEHIKSIMTGFTKADSFCMKECNELLSHLDVAKENRPDIRGSEYIFLCSHLKADKSKTFILYNSKYKNRIILIEFFS